MITSLYDLPYCRRQFRIPRRSLRRCQGLSRVAIATAVILHGRVSLVQASCETISGRSISGSTALLSSDTRVCRSRNLRSIVDQQSPGNVRNRPEYGGAIFENAIALTASVDCTSALFVARYPVEERHGQS